MKTAKAKLLQVIEPKKRVRIWDNYQVIGEVDKAYRIKWVIGACTRDGVRFVNVHEFYYAANEDVWKPSRSGMSIPLLIPKELGTVLIHPYDALVKVLQEAKEVAKEMDLADADAAIYYYR